MKEEALLFGQARSLVGILTDPAEGVREPSLPAVILLNAGIVHRVGPQRLYVKIARRLAAMGFVVLRFDFSGVGESKPRHDHLPFERSAVSEAQDAMNHLAAERGVDRFILAGLCSGADFSLKTACCDPRVVGAVLLNAQGDQLDTGDELRNYFLLRRKARNLWKKALFNPRMWGRAVAGEIDYGDIVRVFVFSLTSKFTRKAKIVSGTSQHATNLRTTIGRGVRLLLVFSEGDTGLDHLQEVFGDELRQLCSTGEMGFHVIPDSDHLFTLLGTQERLLGIVREWAHECFVTARSPAARDHHPAHTRSTLWGGSAEGVEARGRGPRGGQ